MKVYLKVSKHHKTSYPIQTKKYTLAKYSKKNIISKKKLIFARISILKNFLM